MACGGVAQTFDHRPPQQRREHGVGGLDNPPKARPAQKVAAHAWPLTTLRRVQEYYAGPNAHRARLGLAQAHCHAPQLLNVSSWLRTRIRLEHDMTVRSAPAERTHARDR